MFITPDELAEHRADAESRMGAENDGSTVTIRRKTGQLVKDAIGFESPEWAVVATGVPMRLAGTAANSAPYKVETPARGVVNQAARVGHFPAAQANLADGDYVEVTAGENADTVWRLIEVTWQDQATARRLPMEQVNRPTEWGAPDAAA